MVLAAFGMFVNLSGCEPVLSLGAAAVRFAHGMLARLSG
jgi:hypothetical protein